MLKKIAHLFKETWYLIKKEKAYFLAPLILMVVVLAVLIYQMGPAALIAFIYAGV